MQGKRWNADTAELGMWPTREANAMDHYLAVRAVGIFFHMWWRVTLSTRKTARLKDPNHTSNIAPQEL